MAKSERYFCYSLTSLLLAITAPQQSETCLADKGVCPNVVYFSGILYSEMGFPPDQFTSIFAVARSAGWLAHRREQLHSYLFHHTINSAQDDLVSGAGDGGNVAAAVFQGSLRQPCKGNGLDIIRVDIEFFC